MGNQQSSVMSPLAMMAVACQLGLERHQIIKLSENLRAFSDRKGFVSREFFDLALSRAKITQPTALQIFDLLFTMWDHHDMGEIPARKFSVGITPLACFAEDDVSSTLRFAFHVHDERGEGKLTPKGLHDVLISIDNTASYFGDIHLEPEDIDNVVESVFGVRDGRNWTSLPSDLVARRLQNNAYIKRFISGRVRLHVHFTENVKIPQQPSPMDASSRKTPPATPTTPRIRLPSKQFEDKENYQVPVEPPSEETKSQPDWQAPVVATRSASGLDESWASFFTNDNDSHRSRDPPSTIHIYSADSPVNSPITFVRGADPPSFQDEI